MVQEIRVRSLMTRDVVAISPETSVGEIARLMWEHAISGVPVIDEQRRVIGIVTEFDLIAREASFNAPLYVPFLDAFFKVPGTGDETQLRKILATKAAEIMSSPAITIGPEEKIEALATLMYRRRVNPVPVVDEEGRLLGIVSRSDLIWLMTLEERGELPTLLASRS
ncbi:MAG: CBS domain-containing protein [Thermomicrobium sp.]|jgi:CBS domain-containing protein|uniref:CBS domain-containing protein n=1 Tax=Thermomicrobium sp. TaxID=1969469 RepID=UPI001B008E01|nr:CBS domain-containing protein [Thermomicrobium sp.]MBO9350168.1 CBS domain-containing protein [Thermomicrobium sp.]